MLDEREERLDDEEDRLRKLKIYEQGLMILDLEDENLLVGSL
jgi:hypothetical protein